MFRLSFRDLWKLGAFFNNNPTTPFLKRVVERQFYIPLQLFGIALFLKLNLTLVTPPAHNI